MLLVDEPLKDLKKGEALSLPRIKLSSIDLQWVHVLSEGWASPLRGFMRESEFLQMLHFNMLRLENGSAMNMSVPIVLAINNSQKHREKLKGDEGERKKNEKEKGKKKRSQRERKRKKRENIFLLGEEREFIFYFFYFLASRYSAQPFKLKKFSYSTIATACILSISGAKNSNIAI